MGRMSREYQALLFACGLAFGLLLGAVCTLGATRRGGQSRVGGPAARAVRRVSDGEAALAREWAGLQDAIAGLRRDLRQDRVELNSLKIDLAVTRAWLQDIRRGSRAAP